jgi:hypothetical protein
MTRPSVDVRREHVATLAIAGLLVAVHGAARASQGSRLPEGLRAVVGASPATTLTRPWALFAAPFSQDARVATLEASAGGSRLPRLRGRARGDGNHAPPAPTTSWGSSRASPWGAAGARERSLSYPKLWASPVWASTTIVRF